jgi:hypothetical protein
MAAPGVVVLVPTVIVTVISGGSGTPEAVFRHWLVGALLVPSFRDIVDAGP